MALRGFLNYARLALFTKEAGDRQLFRVVKKLRACRIIELGVASLERTAKLIELAVQASPQTPVQYSGFDRFDERGEGDEPLSLIGAHRLLVGSGAKVRLTPGLLSEGVSGMANALPDTDLLLISDLVSDAQLEPLWFYLPRMCHPGTHVLRQQPSDEQSGEEAWESISMSEVNHRAMQSVSRVAA